MKQFFDKYGNVLWVVGQGLIVLVGLSVLLLACGVKPIESPKCPEKTYEDGVRETKSVVASEWNTILDSVNAIVKTANDNARKNLHNPQAAILILEQSHRDALVYIIKTYTPYK